MTKNIIVVDANGKKYGATYRKRAKGLVKQGRARFIGPNMLCLACPPNQNLEDKNMSEQTIENIVTEDAEMESMTVQDTMIESTRSENIPVESTVPEDKYSMEYCLNQIEHIGHQTEYLDQIIAELHQAGNDDVGEAKAMALGQVVECREKTNQQMMQFYEKMYDDLKPPVKVDVVTQKAHLQEQLLKIMDKTLENGDFSANEVTDLFNGALDAIRHISE